MLDFNQKLVCHEKLFLFGLTHATKDATTTGLVNFCSKHFVRLIVLKLSPLEPFTVKLAILHFSEIFRTAFALCKIRLYQKIFQNLSNNLGSPVIIGLNISKMISPNYKCCNNICSKSIISSNE